MKLRTLIAAAIAAAFALPLSAQTAGDKASSGSSAGTTAPSAIRSPSTGSARTSASSKVAGAMFKDLDKNNDGFISRDESKGSPHEKAFDKLDTNADGKLSESEHAAWHAAEKLTGGTSGSGATTAPSDSGSKKY